VKRRIIAAAALGMLLGLTAACGSGKSSGGTGGKPAAEDKNAAGTLAVWLQVDAQTLWPQAVTDATTAFNKVYPNVKVSVSYQAWADHLTKFDAAAQAHTAPDVIEFGNSETAQYAAAGALKDLTTAKADFENSATWLDGLTQSCTMDGKLYCVPYYGGDRAVTYRKDMFADAGIASPPTSWAELMTDIQTLSAKHASDPNFSAFYAPGSYPYGGLPFVYDAGGQIAKQGADGKWTATLGSPEAQKGLTNWKSLLDAGYKGDRTKTNVNSFTQLVNGTAAMFYDSSGQMAAIYGPKGDPTLKDKVGTFVLPSPTNAGQPVPPFMGGSDLAVPKSASHPSWSQAWIKAYTSSTIENQFVAGGFLANSKSIKSADPLRAAFAAELDHTWFVPLAKNWAQVEKDKVINQLLVDIATGKKSVAEATKAADDAINTDLNAS
jgi:N,N'-diacetylchitobiose transport system substrate-binding protein